MITISILHQIKHRRNTDNRVRVCPTDWGLRRMCFVERKAGTKRSGWADSVDATGFRVTSGQQKNFDVAFAGNVTSSNCCQGFVASFKKSL
jgi:hypothetical protein